MVRRLVAGASIVLVVLVATPAIGSAGTRSVSGSILVPAVYGEFTGIVAHQPARCSWLTAGKTSQGVFGHMVKLTAEEGDGGHRYTLSTREVLPARFQVVFYSTLGGTCDGKARPVGYSDVVSSSNPAEGEVPADASHALILLVSRVGTWWPCYTLPPLCFTPSYASRPGASFTFGIDGP